MRYGEEGPQTFNKPRPMALLHHIDARPLTWSGTRHQVYDACGCMRPANKRELASLFMSNETRDWFRLILSVVFSYLEKQKILR